MLILCDLSKIIVNNLLIELILFIIFIVFFIIGFIIIYKQVALVKKGEFNKGGINGESLHKSQREALSTVIDEKDRIFQEIESII